MHILITFFYLIFNDFQGKDWNSSQAMPYNYCWGINQLYWSIIFWKMTIHSIIICHYTDITTMFLFIMNEANAWCTWSWNCCNSKITQVFTTVKALNRYIHTCYSAHSLTGFSVANYMKNQSYLLSLPIYMYILYIYKFYRHYFPNYYPILTHPVNFPCGKKLENPEKTHNFRQCWQTLPTWDQMFNTRIEPTTSVVEGTPLQQTPLLSKQPS